MIFRNPPWSTWPVQLEKISVHHHSIYYNLVGYPCRVYQPCDIQEELDQSIGPEIHKKLIFLPLKFASQINIFYEDDLILSKTLKYLNISF